MLINMFQILRYVGLFIQKSQVDWNEIMTIGLISFSFFFFFFFLEGGRKFDLETSSAVVIGSAAVILALSCVNMMGSLLLYLAESG